MDLLFDGGMVTAGIASDMCHPDFDLFAMKPQVLRINLPNVMAIDVSIDTS